MFARVGCILFAVCLSVLMGCVSADVYRIKEQEAQSLYKANDEMQVRNRTLMAEKTELETRAGEIKRENDGLKDQIEKQQEEIAYVKNKAERLEKETDALREKVDKLNTKIAELSKENQRLATLTRPENLLRTLGERLTELQKQVDTLAGENEKLKSKQVTARIGEDGDRTAETAGERTPAVMVSAGQKTEDTKPDQSVREETKPRTNRERLSDKP